MRSVPRTPFKIPCWIGAQNQFLVGVNVFNFISSFLFGWSLCRRPYFFLSIKCISRCKMCFNVALMPQAVLIFSVTCKKMRLAAGIIFDQVSSKTDVSTSTYEGFKFCTHARVNV